MVLRLVWLDEFAGNRIDVVGSGHAPDTLNEKAPPYPNSPSGMPGVQTLDLVMLNHVAARCSMPNGSRKKAGSDDRKIRARGVKKAPGESRDRQIKRR